jgi:hypothetical protein
VALGQSQQPVGLPAKPNFKEKSTRAKTEFRSPHTLACQWTADCPHSQDYRNSGKRVQDSRKNSGTGDELFCTGRTLNKPEQHKKCHEIKHKYSKYIVI